MRRDFGGRDLFEEGIWHLNSFQTRRRHEIHCLYLMGVARLGLGLTERDTRLEKRELAVAESLLEQVVELDPMHVGAALMVEMFL